MRLYKQIIFILIIFFKTETVLSNNNLFNVNNISLEKNGKITNTELANTAIKNGFNRLISRILLKEDKDKISDLKFNTIRQLVKFYQIKNISNKELLNEKVNFNVTFDKDKIHDLFLRKGILYSNILNEELYILPVLKKNNELFVFNNNFFYTNWNIVVDDGLLEFILPIENIEVIQNINKNKNNLINLEIENIFKEYPNKNLALILIEDIKNNIDKVYIKTRIQGKNISKSINIKNQLSNKEKLYKKIIIDTKNELSNLIKSQNLIDIGAPSFLNVKFDLNFKNNLVNLNSKINKIDLIANIHVNEFNKDYMYLRIKYFGDFKNIINQLKKENINLKLFEGQWKIEILQ